MACCYTTLFRSAGRTTLRASGYALIAALILLVIASLAASAVVYRSSLNARREREDQLLFAGDQIRTALASYRDALAGGGAGQYPKELEELLLDPRFPNPVRHLRRLYPDPMTGEPDWVLERSQGQIIGVHSRSLGKPLRHANFEATDAAFAKAATYSDWHFRAAAAAGTSPAPAGAPKPANLAPTPSAAATDAIESTSQ
jgi:type II secretory pathway pseudopilin PulG